MKKIYLIAIVLALPLFVDAATISVSPATQSVHVGDTFTVSININTSGATIDGVDIRYLNYNPTLLEVQDADSTTAGVQIAPGTLMPVTVANSVNTSTGKVLFSQVVMGGGGYSGSGTLATITFKALAVGTANITIDSANGATMDTNIASAGSDILTSVTGASYTIAAATTGTTGGTTGGTSGGTGGGTSGGTSGGTGGGGGGGGGGSGSSASASAYQMTIIPSGDGSGTVASSPVGINCSYVGPSVYSANRYGCYYSYPTGATVTLTAKASYGSSVSAWSGCASLSSTGVCLVKVDNAKTVGITFSKGISTAPATLINTNVAQNAITNAYGVNYGGLVGGGSAAIVYFSRQLSLGMSGADVKQLQQVLNANGYKVSVSGAGSPGNETSYFGPATQKALQTYQCATFKLCSGTVYTTGYGATGPSTRSALNILAAKLFGTSSSTAVVTNTPTISAEIPTSNYKFTRSLTVGSTGADVKALQQYLNANGFTIASSGAGSPGNETSYFGTLTKLALIKFQNQYAKDILYPVNLTKGTGYFGPSTMKYLNGR